MTYTPARVGGLNSDERWQACIYHAMLHLPSRQIGVGESIRACLRRPLDTTLQRNHSRRVLDARICFHGVPVPTQLTKIECGRSQCPM